MGSEIVIHLTYNQCVVAIKLITRYLQFVFTFFLRLLCISLVPLISPYSVQILLENALFCRQNVRFKSRLFCSKFT